MAGKKKKYVPRARLLKGEKKTIDDVFERSLQGLGVTPEVQQVFRDNKGVMLEAAKIAKKMVEKALGPLPPCYFCGKESESAMIRPFKPQDIESPDAFSKAMREMRLMPSRLESMPAVYVCHRKRCHDRLDAFLKEQKG